MGAPCPDFGTSDSTTPNLVEGFRPAMDETPCAPSIERLLLGWVGDHKGKPSANTVLFPDEAWVPRMCGYQTILRRERVGNQAQQLTPAADAIVFADAG